MRKFMVRSLFCTGRHKNMETFPVENYEVGERLDRFLKKSPLGWVSAQIGLRKK